MSRYVLAAAAAALSSVFAFAPATAKATTALAYASGDTRSQGSVTVSPFSNDGNGSLELQTFTGDSNGKASVVFYDPSLNPLGTLGTLNLLSADFYKSSSPASPAKNQFAYRLWTNSTGTQALVWENNYNGNGDVPTDAWQSTGNLVTGAGATGNLFWERANNTNFDTNTNFQTISTWAGGFTPPGGATLNALTQIYAVEIAFGSSVSPFTGFVDNVQIGFTGGQTFAADAAVTPLPNSAVAGLALCTVLAATQLRKRLATPKTA